MFKNHPKCLIQFLIYLSRIFVFKNISASIQIFERKYFRRKNSSIFGVKIQIREERLEFFWRENSNNCCLGLFLESKKKNQVTNLSAIQG